MSEIALRKRNGFFEVVKDGKVVPHVMSILILPDHIEVKTGGNKARKGYSETTTWYSHGEIELDAEE